MAAHEDYTFTVEQAYFFRDYWNEHPEKQEALRAFVRSGQLCFSPGFWTVPDMSMPNGESMYMQATLGQRFLSETVGYSPRSVLIADCWGHYAQLPQILTQCGYRYYLFSRCMRRDWDMENFRWRGLDGTEINTHWMSTGYAGVIFPGDNAAVNAEELHWEQASKEGILRLCRRNAAKCGEDDQLLPVGGDMMIPSSAAPVIIGQLKDDPDLPSIAFRSIEDSLAGIDYAQKPVFTGEFIGALKGSFAANIDLKLRNRAAESMLCSLEALSVLQGKRLSFTPQWEALLKNQFHDILCGTICNQALLQARGEFRRVCARAGCRQGDDQAVLRLYLG